ncbi:hypothetical protein MHYP_G00337510 [Metynnis hypsauchen]
MKGHSKPGQAGPRDQSRVQLSVGSSDLFKETALRTPSSHNPGYCMLMEPKRFRTPGALRIGPAICSAQNLKRVRNSSAEAATAERNKPQQRRHVFPVMKPLAALGSVRR